MKNICYPMGGVEYSTTERVVGKWIDGKPIYQKTATVISPSEGNTAINVELPINNPDKIINIYGFVDKGTPAISWLPFVDNAENHRDYHFLTWCVFANNKLYARINCGTQQVNTPVTYTVQYTKTTD